jgi:hypothetical protein
MFRRPDWKPAKGSSIFEFGTSIVSHVTSKVALFNDKGEPGAHPLMTRYFCEELEAIIVTAMDKVHRILPDVCLYRGHNLMGMDRSRLLALLHPAEPVVVYDNWREPDETPGAWMIKYPGAWPRM